MYYNIQNLLGHPVVWNFLQLPNQFWWFWPRKNFCFLDFNLSINAVLLLKSSQIDIWKSFWHFFLLVSIISQDHKHQSSKEIVAFLMINHECCMHCFQLYWCFSHDEVICSKCQHHTHHKCIGMRVWMKHTFLLTSITTILRYWHTKVYKNPNYFTF